MWQRSAATHPAWVEHISSEGSGLGFSRQLLQLLGSTGSTSNFMIYHRPRYHLEGIQYTAFLDKLQVMEALTNLDRAPLQLLTFSSESFCQLSNKSNDQSLVHRFVTHHNYSSPGLTSSTDHAPTGRALHRSPALSEMLSLGPGLCFRQHRNLRPWRHEMCTANKKEPWRACQCTKAFQQVADCTTVQPEAENKAAWRKKARRRGRLA